MARLIMTGWTRPVAPGVRGPLMADDMDIIAIGDVHGRGEAFEALLLRLADLPRPRRREVVLLGDLIDRGDRNIDTVKMALDAGDLLGADAVHRCIGNHELMLADAMRKPKDHWYVWFANGGCTVLDEIADRVGIEVRTPEHIPDAVRAAFPEAWLTEIDTGQGHVQIGPLLFVHGGVDPDDIAGCLAMKPHEHRDEEGFNHRHWAWLRDPFLQHEGWNGQIVVHGHTMAFERGADIEHADDLRGAMDRMTSNGRLNLDAGAALGERIGFCQFKSDGYRIGVMEAA